MCLITLQLKRMLNQLEVAVSSMYLNRLKSRELRLMRLRLRVYLILSTMLVLRQIIMHIVQIQILRNGLISMVS